MIELFWTAQKFASNLFGLVTFYLYPSLEIYWLGSIFSHNNSYIRNSVAQKNCHRLDVEEDDNNYDNDDYEDERLSTRTQVSSQLEEALRITQDLAKRARKVP